MQNVVSDGGSNCFHSSLQTFATKKVKLQKSNAGSSESMLLNSTQINEISEFTVKNEAAFRISCQKRGKKVGKTHFKQSLLPLQDWSFVEIASTIIINRSLSSEKMFDFATHEFFFANCDSSTMNALIIIQIIYRLYAHVEVLEMCTTFHFGYASTCSKSDINHTYSPHAFLGQIGSTSPLNWLP